MEFQTNDRVYRDLVESSSELFWCCDAEGRYTYLNAVWERIYGYPINEMLDRSFTELQLPEIARDDRNELFRRLAVSPVIDHEIRHITKSGREIVLLLTAHPVNNSDGVLIGAMGTARDVTDERRVSANLQVSPRPHMETSDSMIVADVSGIITLVNAATEKMFGRNRDELVGSPITVLMPEEYHGVHSAGLRNVDKRGATYVHGTLGEVEGLRADGTRFPIELQVSRIVGGDSAAFVTMISDITDRRNLKEAEEKLRIRVAALDAAADQVVITDPDGKIEYVNRAFSGETGYEPEEVIGSNPRILKSGFQDSDYYRDLWKTVRSGKVWSGTLINRRKDGTEYPEEMTITPVMGDDGEVFRMIAIKRNIAEKLRLMAVKREAEESLRVATEREAARELEAENSELQRINEARSEFLSTVSHELRTPLTSMMAFSEILRHNKENNLTATQLKHLELISKGGHRLEEMITDLLDVSLSETGRFRLEPMPFDLREMIEEVANSSVSVFDKRGQSLIITNLPDPTWMDGDRSRVMQVFNNLLSNAAKYSPDGASVELVATVEQNIIQLVFRDHGIGISHEDQLKLFAPFFRAGNQKTRSESGTGLGLVIVKTIVELHGGHIKLESQQGVGTTVRIWLPGILSGPPGHVPDADAASATASPPF